MLATVLTAGLLLFVALPVGLSDDVDLLSDLEVAFAAGWVQLGTGDEHVLEVDRRLGFVRSVRLDGVLIDAHRVMEEDGVVTVLDAAGAVRAQAPLHRSDHGLWLATGSLPRLGLWSQEQGRTLIITDVRPGSPADAAGLQIADRVLLIDGRPATRGALATALAGRIAGGGLPIDVERAGQRLARLMWLDPLLPEEQLKRSDDPLGTWLAVAPDAPPARQHFASVNR